jgi:hypothetical protein
MQMNISCFPAETSMLGSIFYANQEMIRVYVVYFLCGMTSLYQQEPNQQKDDTAVIIEFSWAAGPLVTFTDYDDAIKVSNLLSPPSYTP